jgi:ankyrin repeat protein
VTLLLLRGADPGARCGSGFTPLLLAALRGSSAAVVALLRFASPAPDKSELEFAKALADFVGHLTIVNVLGAELSGRGSQNAGDYVWNTTPHQICRSCPG